jgi:hypothetical protein
VQGCCCCCYMAAPVRLGGLLDGILQTPARGCIGGGCNRGDCITTACIDWPSHAYACALCIVGLRVRCLLCLCRFWGSVSASPSHLQSAVARTFSASCSMSETPGLLGMLQAKGCQKHRFFYPGCVQPCVAQTSPDGWQKCRLGLSHCTMPCEFKPYWVCVDTLWSY